MGIDFRARRAGLIAFAGLALVAGCGEEPPELSEVGGVVTLDGEPLPEVTVTFMPLRGEGEEPKASSTAVTDDAGNYSLTYRARGETLPGAAVGSHVVVLGDRRAAMQRDDPVPSRVPSTYAQAGSSPLKVTVTDAPEQQIDLEVRSGR